MRGEWGLIKNEALLELFIKFTFIIKRGLEKTKIKCITNSLTLKCYCFAQIVNNNSEDQISMISIINTK